MKISRIYSAAVIMVAALALTSCNNKKFHINGNITEAQGLYALPGEPQPEWSGED